MIRFSLRCKNEHSFEGWFAGNEDYEKQKRTGLILCPVCNTSAVGKSLMLPNIATARAKAERRGQREKHELQGERGNRAANSAFSASASGSETGGGDVSALPCPKSREEALQKLLVLQKMQRRKLEVLHKLQDLARKMRENAENVGERFPEEARKIHFGEGKKRAIYGRAEAKEAQALLEDGIDILPLPRLPEDGN